jgi:hypothetical protein
MARLKVPDRQIQKAGAGSWQIQAQVYNAGLGYADVREIAMDVFRQNFLTLAGDAVDLARTRAESITNRYLDGLQNRYPEGLASASDPGLQRILYQVQTEFAVSIHGWGLISRFA